MQFFTISTPLPPFLPYPQFLLEIPLSETAKLVYVLLLSRIKLSQSNGWTDSNGHVYCRYTIQNLMEDTGKSKSTIVTALNDLEKQDLLFRRRGGAGYANMLHLKFPVIHTSEVPKTTPQKAGKPDPNNKTNNKTNYNTNYKTENKRNQNHIPDYDYGGDSL